MNFKFKNLFATVLSFSILPFCGTFPCKGMYPMKRNESKNHALSVTTTGKSIKKQNATIFNNETNNSMALSIDYDSTTNAIVNEKGEAKECFICLNCIKNSDHCMVFGCGVNNFQNAHIVHYDCAVPWLQSKSTCPYCGASGAFFSVQFEENAIQKKIPRKIVEMQCTGESFSNGKFTSISNRSRNKFIIRDLNKVVNLTCCICNGKIGRKIVLCGCAKDAHNALFYSSNLTDDERKSKAAEVYESCYNHAICYSCAFNKLLEAIGNKQSPLLSCPIANCKKSDNYYSYYLFRPSIKDINK